MVGLAPGSAPVEWPSALPCPLSCGHLPAERMPPGMAAWQAGGSLHKRAPTPALVFRPCLLVTGRRGPRKKADQEGRPTLVQIWNGGMASRRLAPQTGADACAGFSTLPSCYRTAWPEEEGRPGGPPHVGSDLEWRHGKPEARSTNGRRRLRWFFDPAFLLPDGVARGRRQTRRSAPRWL